MARFFADRITGDYVVFIEDAAHMAKTLRMKKGDRLFALDGSGAEYLSEITEISPNRITAKIIETHTANYEPDIKITVYQGLTRQTRLETVVQKCVELGACRIVPVEFSRCEMRIKDITKAKLERYNKIAREAAKQCGRAKVPEVAEPIPFEKLLDTEHELLLCPYEEEKTNTLKSVLKVKEQVKDIGLVIGPEGGMEKHEADAVKNIGGHVITLGPRILRTETAAPAVIAALMYHFDQWKYKGKETD